MLDVDAPLMLLDASLTASVCPTTMPVPATSNGVQALEYVYGLWLGRLM